MRGRIWHLIDSNLGSDFFRSIARHHDRQRFPACVGSVEPPGRLQAMMREEGVPTFALGARSRRQYPRALWRLVRLLRWESVALLHAHCFYPTLLGLAAARLAGTPLVFTRHHSDHHVRLGKRWHVWLDGWCARRADHVIAVSDATRRILTDIEGVPGERIAVIHNGMEPVRRPVPDRVARVRQELALGDEPVCLTPARLHEEKGHRFLFDAVPGILSRVGPVTFLLAGEGPHRAQLEELTRVRGVQDRVRFLGWRTDLPELMTLASLVVLPSLAESFGFVLLEAMSLGRPVVATTTGGIPEVVAHGETGLLVPKADPQALEEAVCHILTNRAAAEAMGQAGPRRAALFSFPRMIQGYEALYRQVLLRPHAGRITPGAFSRVGGVQEAP